MVLRRRQRPPEPAAPRPAWRDRFDEAVTLIRSRPQPGWIDERLGGLEAALVAAQTDIEKLSSSIDTLDPAGTAAQLKQQLRAAEQRLPGTLGADGDRTIAALRRRHEMVNALMNQRQEIVQRIADSIADLELLAVESMHRDVSTADGRHGLDQHLERLEIDLEALHSAREELRPW